MSEQQGEHAFADLDKYYTVFAGSSPEDVAYAKVFWNSFNLHPPLESRLVSADMRQRLQVAGSTRDSRGCPTSDRRDEKLQEVYIKQRLEEKQRYLEMAKKRDDTLALLKKQREERIKKEMISLPYKPNQCEKKERPTFRSLPEEAHRDIKDVQDLK
ncbi:cilia- and flagella-associated protein HOATZ isoform X1 [Scleropages formosus]|uniref:Cilia- and flagella-associated protein HOATZ n=1 Tax=Scleropages formosus TaxID=113540 RepID=A0A8C9RHH0_SCLFO|nr:UPF0722 protein C11orf88 homolog isoform X1 [Scleropages formosus]